MVKIKQEYPLQEYVAAKKSPIYIELHGNRFVVPVSYNGDKQKFVDDLFSRDEVIKTYPKGERKYAYVEIDGYKVIAPHRWASGKLDFQIINRMMDMAILKYNNAVRIAKMHRKTTSQFSSESLISLDNSLTDKQVNGIAGFLGKRTRNALHKINEFELKVGEKGVRHTINYGARLLSGVLAAPVVLAAAVSQKNEKRSQNLIKIAKLILKPWQKDLLDKDQSQETAEKLNELADKICDRITLLIERFSSRFANWSRKNSPQAVAVAKNDLSENKKKAALYTAITTSFIGGGAALSGNNGNKSNSSENQITVTDTNQTPLPNTKQTYTPVKYTITDRQSFEDAFNASLPLIHRALLATEWFSSDGYSDNKNPAKNTIGKGLYWFPNTDKFRADGSIDIDNINWKTVEWIKTKEYLKKHPNFKINYKDAKFVTEQWYKTREGGRIITKMSSLLKGCELAPHELAAIASVYYNDESCGRKLCSFVHDNYQNKFACAEYISKLQPKDSSFDEGIQKRHCHEALYYLNYNNYCARVLDFNVNSGVNSKGRFVVNTAPTSLEIREYQGFLSELHNHKLGVQTDRLVEKMCKFAPESGINFTTVSLREFINTNATDAKNMTQVACYDSPKTVDILNVVKSAQRRA